jgi:hypothetical protein
MFHPVRGEACGHGLSAISAPVMTVRRRRTKTRLGAGMGMKDTGDG